MAGRCRSTTGSSGGSRRASCDPRREADRGRLRNHLLPYFGERALKDITPLTVRGWVATALQDRSVKTVRNAHALLSIILRDAVLDGLILSNPCTGTRLPSGEPYQAAFLSQHQIDRLLAAAPDEYRTLLQLAVGTGMRWGELAGLQARRVDLLRRHIDVAQTLIEVNGRFSIGEPKSRNSRRLVSLPPTLVDLLAAHLSQRPFGPEDLLFTSPGGVPLSRGNFHSRVWRPTTRAAGLIPAPRFHDLRHTHVALLIAANVPIKAIQMRLGHASIVMTMDRYGHLMDTVDEALLEALEGQLRGA